LVAGVPRGRMLLLRHINTRLQRKWLFLELTIYRWFAGDRDGMFVAAYRIAFAGWTAEEAVHEMRAFHYQEFLHPNMKW
jgi:hypothetical protein